jgi:hypothetical protein
LLFANDCNGNQHRTKVQYLRSTFFRRISEQGERGSLS